MSSLHLGERGNVYTALDRRVRLLWRHCIRAALPDDEVRHMEIGSLRRCGFPVSLHGFFLVSLHEQLRGEHATLARKYNLEKARAKLFKVRSMRT